MTDYISVIRWISDEVKWKPKLRLFIKTARTLQVDIRVLLLQCQYQNLEKNSVILYSTVKTGEWSTKDARAFINGILEKTGELPDPNPTPDPNPGVVVPADGIYKVNNVVSSSAMFRVVGCTLTVKNGKMSAVLTLSGTGYDYLYLGTKEEAAKADKSLWVPFKEDNNGKYTYTVPLESLDKEIAVAAFSHNRQSWYGRTLVFHSDSLEKIGDISNEGNGGTNGRQYDSIRI